LNPDTKKKQVLSIAGPQPQVHLYITLDQEAAGLPVPLWTPSIYLWWSGMPPPSF